MMTLLLDASTRPSLDLAEEPARRPRRRMTFTSLLFYGILIAWAVASLGPLVWMLVNSMRSSNDIFSTPIGPPDLGHVSNYSEAWANGDLGTALLNSVVVAIGAVLLGGTCAMLIGFALSRGRLPFSGILTTFFLLGLMIPAFSLLIPILLEFQSLGLISSRFGLVLVNAGFMISIGVFLFKGAFDAIPNEYIEAASIDGASVPRLLLAILLPMIRPTMATFAILAFLGAYNDFIFALVLNNDLAVRTLPVAILTFSVDHTTDYGQVFAAVSIATLPPLLAYLFLRKQVQTSMAMGGRTG